MLKVNINPFQAYSPLKNQKTSVFLMFSGGIEIQQMPELG